MVTAAVQLTRHTALGDSTSDGVSRYFTNIQDEEPERQNTSLCGFWGSKCYIFVDTSSYFIAFVLCFDLCQAKGCAQNESLLYKHWKWRDKWLSQAKRLLN